MPLLPTSSLFTTAPVLPAAGADVRRTAGGPGAGSSPGALLRAEVEPAARGLDVAGHAARVLDALMPAR